MALDEQIQRVIEVARAANAPRTDQLPLAMARSLYRERYVSRTLPVEAGVIIERLSLPGAEGAIEARLYRPPGAAHGALPLIVYFHGGGFVLGDADAYEPQSTVLAKRSNSLVLFVEYRLAPEFPFPAAINDAIAAVTWASRHAAQLGADPKRLAVMGDSAGGNLAANACIAARDTATASIELQCLLYPAVDYRYLVGGASSGSLQQFANGFLLDEATRQWFFKQYFSDPQQVLDSRASLVTADLAGLPRALVFTAECDPLRDLGKAFFDALASHGSPAEYRCLPGMIHNFMGYTAVSDGAHRAFCEVTDLLQARLHRPV